MADHPYDAPASRRRNTPLPPFVAPRSPGDSGRTPRQADIDSRRPFSTPTRLFTPPGIMPRYTPPAGAPSGPAAPEHRAADEEHIAADADQTAACEGRGVGAPVLHDGSDASEDWFEVVDEADEAGEADERTEVPAEPAVLTPSLFNGLSGIEAIGPTADPGTAARPEAAEADPYAWPDPRAVVAEVLERLAVRVREGDLILPADIPATTEEAALAAVLSALLRSGLR